MDAKEHLRKVLERLKTLKGTLDVPERLETQWGQ
jgi:hypothetical protein